MAIRRVNRGRNHTYLINDKPSIGVTTALGLGMPKPALMHWAARSVAEHVIDMSPEDYSALTMLHRDEAVRRLKAVPFTRRDAAAERGTDVHAIAEMLIHGEDVDVPEPLSGYVESTVRFMDEWRVQPLLVEKVVGSYTWNYSGTFDLIAELPDQRRVLFDYKTSLSGIWPETALQLAAYRFADVYVGDDGTEMPIKDVGIDCCKAVWIRPDGYDVVPLVADERVFKGFLHVLSVARLTQVMKDLVLPAEPAP